jgi:hypothetical protein
LLSKIRRRSKWFANDLRVRRSNAKSRKSQRMGTMMAGDADKNAKGVVFDLAGAAPPVA